MTPDLSRRVGRALSVGNATPRQRLTVIKASEKAADFDDLPAAVQRLIEHLEEPVGGSVA